MIVTVAIIQSRFTLVHPIDAIPAQQGLLGQASIQAYKFRLSTMDPLRILYLLPGIFFPDPPQVHVKPGDEVARGSILMTVEGMKMEVYLFYFFTIDMHALFEINTL